MDISLPALDTALQQVLQSALQADSAALDTRATALEAQLAEMHLLHSPAAAAFLAHCRRLAATPRDAPAAGADLPAVAELSQLAGELALDARVAKGSAAPGPQPARPLHRNPPREAAPRRPSGGGGDGRMSAVAEAEDSDSSLSSDDDDQDNYDNVANVDAVPSAVAAEEEEAEADNVELEPEVKGVTAYVTRRAEDLFTALEAWKIDAMVAVTVDIVGFLCGVGIEQVEEKPTRKGKKKQLGE